MQGCYRSGKLGKKNRTGNQGKVRESGLKSGNFDSKPVDDTAHEAGSRGGSAGSVGPARPVRQTYLPAARPHPPARPRMVPRGSMSESSKILSSSNTSLIATSFKLREAMIATSPAGCNERHLDHCDDEDSFFELLSRFQSERMDDQRCSLAVPTDNKENKAPLINSAKLTPNSEAQDDLLDLIVGMQSKRMDEQRVALPHLPGLCPPQGAGGAPDEGFLEMLMRCQGARLEDQRSSLPEEPPRGATVPDEDFFSLIMRLQSGRMEDQRATVPGALK
ncbi:G-protein-signaling modulator 2 [Homalodisca vitripennis]|nr:G-protein-signaling modulator 2 [Homalodisca vitripennis]